MTEIYKEYRNREYKTECSKGYTFWDKRNKEKFKKPFVRQSSTKMGGGIENFIVNIILKTTS